MMPSKRFVPKSPRVASPCEAVGDCFVVPPRNDLHRLRIVIGGVAFEEVSAENPRVSKTLRGGNQAGSKAQLSSAEASCWRKGIIAKKDCAGVIRLLRRTSSQ